MFGHIIHARRKESHDRQWQLTAAVQQNRNQEDQVAVWKQAERIGQVGKRRRSPYEVVPVAERIVMIGGDLQAFGVDWEATHGDQLQWLAAQGISREEAIKRSDAWTAERFNEWQPPAQ